MENTITLPRDFVSDSTDVLEDTVQYFCSELAKDYGIMVSGETMWKLVQAYASAKEAQFAGLTD